jgi:hypothetical protein
MTFNIEKNILFIGNQSLHFDFPVKQYLVVNNILVLLLDVPSGKIFNENVFGIDLESKKIIWQIQEMRNRYVQEFCPYTYMKETESKSIVLSNCCSFYLEINPFNGEILEEGMWK